MLEIMKEKENMLERTGNTQFDPKELNRIGRNDKAFTLQMLELFVASAKKCGKKIRSSIKENKWEELKAIAHKNIPTYIVMGLNEIADFLKYIEENALNKDKHKSIEDRVKTLQPKNSEAIDAVRKYIGLIKTEEIATAESYSYGI
jgi:HPt (histidine-containing phosphotransfer) domain-containing protein